MLWVFFELKRLPTDYHEATVYRICVKTYFLSILIVCTRVINNKCTYSSCKIYSWKKKLQPNTTWLGKKKSTGSREENWQFCGNPSLIWTLPPKNSFVNFLKEVHNLFILIPQPILLRADVHMAEVARASGVLHNGIWVRMVWWHKYNMHRQVFWIFCPISNLLPH